MNWLCLLAVLTLLAVPGRVSAQQPAPPPQSAHGCGIPESAIQPREPLSRLGAALKAGQPVHILALGSGTTVGMVNGPPGAAFPYRMLDALRQARPAVTFDLTVQGGRNMTAEAMLSVLDTTLKTQHFSLVIWQTGTVEAVKGLRPDGMRSVLQAGADKVRDAGGNLVLIDPQFSRFLRANTDLEPYIASMQQVAMLPGTTLFNRFELMRGWVNDGHLDLERVPRNEREAAVRTLNTCLGEALARFVLAGADTPP